MKHTSINCCTYGADLVTTDPATGRVYMIQWSWEQVQQFVIEHGTDMTEKTRSLMTQFYEEGTNEATTSVPAVDGNSGDTPNRASNAEGAGESPALKGD